MLINYGCGPRVSISQAIVKPSAISPPCHHERFKPKGICQVQRSNCGSILNWAGILNLEKYSLWGVQVYLVGTSFLLRHLPQRFGNHQKPQESRRPRGALRVSVIKLMMNYPKWPHRSEPYCLTIVYYQGPDFDDLKIS